MGVVTSKDGTSIAFSVVGSGPALIIVGGATQFRQIAPDERALAEQLSAHFAVVSYDRRGRGESSDNTSSYTPALEIEDLAALIAANGGHASLLGFSSGAVLAMEAAAVGLPVDSLVMYEPPIMLRDSGSSIPPDYVETLNSYTAKGKRAETVEYFLTAAIGLPTQAIGGIKASPMWPLLESIAPTIAYDGAIMMGSYVNGMLPARWKSVQIPVLVINGDRSFPFMPAAADAVASHIPNGHRATLAGQDHGPKPEILAPVADAFLRGA